MKTSKSDFSIKPLKRTRSPESRSPTLKRARVQSTKGEDSWTPPLLDGEVVGGLLAKNNTKPITFENTTTLLNRLFSNKSNVQFQERIPIRASTVAKIKTLPSETFSRRETSIIGNGGNVPVPKAPDPPLMQVRSPSYLNNGASKTSSVPKPVFRVPLTPEITKNQKDVSLSSSASGRTKYPLPTSKSQEFSPKRSAVVTSSVASPRALYRKEYTMGESCGEISEDVMNKLNSQKDGFFLFKHDLFNHLKMDKPMDVEFFTHVFKLMYPFGYYEVKVGVFETKAVVLQVHFIFTERELAQSAQSSMEMVFVRFLEKPDIDQILRFNNLVQNQKCVALRVAGELNALCLTQFSDDVILEIEKTHSEFNAANFKCVSVLIEEHPRS